MIALGLVLTTGEAAQAAMTVRAQWDMSSLPAMIDSAGGDNAAVAACSFKGANGVSGQSYGTVNLAGTGFQTITCIKTASTIQVIAAGQTRTSDKAVGSISNNAPVYVGGKGDGTEAFDGVMDFVKIEIG